MLILIASAVISGMLGDVESAAVIVIVITINAILGTVQTVKAEQSLQSLKKLSGPEAKVLRNGVAVQLPARELVVGDVILLEAGDMIPADGRLIENASLKVDESALTGESLAVEKSMDIILEEAPLGDRTNMLFSGALIFLAVMLILCLVRAIKGPRVADRIIAVNMMGTMVMVIIGILAVKMQEGYLVDICLIYAMISFLAVIVLTKVYTGVYKEKKEKGEK